MIYTSSKYYSTSKMRSKTCVCSLPSAHGSSTPSLSRGLKHGRFTTKPLYQQNNREPLPSSALRLQPEEMIFNIHSRVHDTFTIRGCKQDRFVPLVGVTCRRACDTKTQACGCHCSDPLTAILPCLYCNTAPGKMRVRSPRGTRRDALAAQCCGGVIAGLRDPQ